MAIEEIELIAQVQMAKAHESIKIRVTKINASSYRVDLRKWVDVYEKGDGEMSTYEGFTKEGLSLTPAQLDIVLEALTKAKAQVAKLATPAAEKKAPVKKAASKRVKRA